MTARTFTLIYAGFQADAVAEGRKRRTIRRGDRVPAVGQLLRHTAGRGPTWRLLREAPCIAVDEVWLCIHAIDGITDAAVNGEPVRDLDEFAELDHFRSLRHMGEFMRHLHGSGDFRGVMIRW
jgi:hypothetical protein